MTKDKDPSWFEYELNPELAEMFAALDDPERNVDDALRDAQEAVIRVILDDTGVRYLIEEIVRRTMDRPPMLDEGGEDPEYWSTVSLVYMKVLGGVINEMYYPHEEE